MEKLINLLNEYEQLNMCRKFDNFAMHTFENSSWVDSILEDTVISSRYGFIQRLIENDKIDTNKLEKIWYEETVYMYDWQYIEIVEYSDYESLLMLLSIQDKPIEFLISVLK